MKYSVSPVVRVAVQPKQPADLPKLLEGLKRLSKSDPLVQCYIEESGQNVIAGSGELHIDICLHDLQKEYAQCDIISSDPIVSYRESVLTKSSQICLAKTSNGHNRFYGTAEPISQELCTVIEKGEMGPKDDLKGRAKRLVDEFSWSKDEALKIWTFGPENIGANVLVDVTKGVQYMDEVRDSLDNSFQWVSKQAILTEENLRGVRFNVVDALLHADSIHRGGGQVIPAGRRLYHACTLTASPVIQEPMFSCDITCPLEAIGGVYQCLNQRRGEVVEQEQLNGTPLVVIKAYLPVAESFGFTGALRGATGGQAFPQCVFHHWNVISGSPLEVGSKPYEIVMETRKRKGLKEALPKLEDYLDKLNN
jgi:elongation factor 2